MSNPRPPCVPGIEHFFFGNRCVICGIELPCCVNCKHSYDADAPDRVACGHGVDDDNPSNNPIWAIRKYSLEGFRVMLTAGGRAVEGFDCDNMRKSDGRNCPTFAWKEPR
jgi:hypothetical protein